MPRIAIITDTDSSLPLDLAKQYNIVEIPIVVQFGEESYRDVYEIDNAAVFTRVDREGKLPSTAAPSPGKFVDAYRAAFDHRSRIEPLLSYFLFLIHSDVF